MNRLQVKLERVVSPKNKWFKSLWRLYRKALPSVERRFLPAQKKVLGKKNFFLFAAVSGKKLTGLVAVWRFADFCFLEHLAVQKSLRSKGIGTQIVQMVQKRFSPLVLESDLPKNAVSKARIRFYRKAGFHVNRFAYLQPPYHGTKSVPMVLLSWPGTLSKKTFSLRRDTIHGSVYGCSVPLMRN